MSEEGRKVTSYELAKAVCFRSTSNLNGTYLNNDCTKGRFDMEAARNTERINESCYRCVSDEIYT